MIYHLIIFSHLSNNYHELLEQYQLLKKGLSMIVQAVQRVEEVMEATPGVEKGIEPPTEAPPQGRMLYGGRQRESARDYYVPF